MYVYGKKTEYVNKTFRMPAELVVQMEAIAQNKDISLNNLVVQCCEYALENIAPDCKTNNKYYDNK